MEYAPINEVLVPKTSACNFGAASEDPVVLKDSNKILVISLYKLMAKHLQLQKDYQQLINERNISIKSIKSAKSTKWTIIIVILIIAIIYALIR